MLQRGAARRCVTALQSRDPAPTTVASRPRHGPLPGAAAGHTGHPVHRPAPAPPLTTPHPNPRGGGPQAGRQLGPAGPPRREVHQ